MARHRITEHGAPLADRAVAGEEQTAALVAARDELEEEMGGIGLKGQIAELVDDQQLRFGEEAEPLLEPVLGVRLGERGHQRRRRHKQHRVALANGSAAEGDSKMRLADAARQVLTHHLGIAAMPPEAFR
jgi:hypothetical protein